MTTYYPKGARSYKTKFPTSKPELHESGLFFVKGRDTHENGKRIKERNGILLKQYPEGVKNIEILDEQLTPICLPWKTFYFHPEDANKMVLITTSDDEQIEFVYDYETLKFVRRRSPLFDDET